MMRCSSVAVTRCSPSVGSRSCPALRRLPCGRLSGGVLPHRVVREVASVRASATPPSAEDEGGWEIGKVLMPVSALVVCALLSGAVIPEEAWAARSGGRMGGSSFRSRAPMPRRGGGGGGGYRQYNYYGSPGIAPPLIGGYGYGMGGYGLMPSFFFPIGFGGIFNIFIAMFVLSAVSNAIKNFQNRNDDRDDFDDFDDL